MGINSDDIVPMTQVRANFTDLAEQVRGGKEKIITRNGESYVALVGARRLDHYHRLERERIHLTLLEQATRGIADIDAGHTRSVSDVRDKYKAAAQHKRQRRMRSRLRITANFEGSLDWIRELLVEQGSPVGFDELLSQLFDDVIPNLERFPRMGHDFLANEPHSEEGRAKQHALRVMIGTKAEVREYVAGDYLLLYAVRDDSVFLLSIRYHRQLSFDFRSHWH